MYLDAALEVPSLSDAALYAQAAERLGLDGVWTTEIKHDPFLPLALAAAATERISLGTAIAVAFPRSPTVTAYTAWDLARASGGRFILGLGTQVKAHIERRFSAEWSAPAERMRDYIAAVRAVWRCWQTGERLRYEGQFYTLKLMTPFFSPGPLPHAEPPVFIAGVNHGLCRLAGEICQGLHVHPLHTTRYLREAALPWIGEGLAAAGRDRREIQVSASVFAIVGRGSERAQAREETRRQVAFYASTPNYRTLLEIHGWEQRGEELSRLARGGRWDQMAGAVSDEMLAELAVEGETLPEAAAAAKRRYSGLADRVTFYLPFVPGERDEEWAAAAATLHE